MCMKNINTDVILFNKILSNEADINNINLLGISKDIPIVHATKVNEKLLRIPDLDIFLSISAAEKINTDSKKPIHEDNETPADTFFMDEKYRLRLRVTETHSGKFFDLDTITIVPNYVTLCRRIYSQKSLLHYSNVLVSMPPEGKDLCVLKVLIQHESQETWIIQSMHPIRLIIDE